MSEDSIEARCLSCAEPLTDAGYLITSINPKKYIGTWYCDNHKCIKYGLITIYKLREPME